MAQALPQQLRINSSQLVVAWSFLYPFLAKRAAASAPVWDDRLVTLFNVLISNQDFQGLLESVLNGDKPVSALQLEAPPELRMEVRAFAPSLPFVEGWLRDTASAIDTASYVSAQRDMKTGDAATVAIARNQQLAYGATGQPYNYEGEPQTFQQQRLQQMQQHGAEFGTQNLGAEFQQGQQYAQPQAQVSQPYNPAAPGVGPGYAGMPDGNAMQTAEPIGLAQLQAEKQHTPIPDYVGGKYVIPPQQQAYGQQTNQPITAESLQAGYTQRGNQAGGYSPTDETPESAMLGQPQTQGMQFSQQGQQNPQQAAQQGLQDTAAATQQEQLQSHQVEQRATVNAAEETPEQRAQREQAQRESQLTQQNQNQ